MTIRRALLVALSTTVVAVIGWLLFVGVPRWFGRPVSVATGPTNSTTAPAAGRKIKAHLFYVADDGLRLVSVEHDVPFGDGASEQAKEIIKAQLEAAAPPLVSAIPAGTRLRALFVTPEGYAYVDLSGEVRSAHPGGSSAELLTAYTFVHALTANLPAVRAVQLLVDGKEVETLAGHVSLRGPLLANNEWVVE